MSTQEQGITIDGLPSLEQFSPEAIIYVVLNDQDFHIKFSDFQQLLVDNLPSVVIPEGLSTVEDMQTYVNELLANESFAQKVTTALEQSGAFNDVVQRIESLEQADEDLVTRDQLTAIVESLATKNDIIGLEGSSSNLGKIFFVNLNSENLEENGSPEAPFKTIQAAIEAVPSTSVIQLSPGSYHENLTFVRDNILIQGYGCVGSNIAEIVGTVTYGTETSPNITRCRFKDVTLKNSAIDEPVVSFNDNLGRHYFDNVVIEPMTGTTVPAVDFVGKTKNWVVFRNCEMGGLIKFDGPITETPLVVHFENGGHPDMEIVSNSKVKIKMTGVNKGKKITVNNGSIQASRISGFTGIEGVSIEINSGADESHITYSDFLGYETNPPSIWWVGKGATLIQAYNLFYTTLDQGPGTIEHIAGLFPSPTP